MSTILLTIVSLKMASRVIFDPSSCFSHFLINRLKKAHDVPAPTLRQFSDYLKIVPIEGKGFGVVAIKDIEPCTLLFAEAAAGAALVDPASLTASNESILQAVSHMTPEIRARFYALHEGPRPFITREMRIWKTNCFDWPNPNMPENSWGAICIDMSRINHSCLPNTDYMHNPSTDKMELYSTRAITAGTEITIRYGLEFEYCTADERKARLRYIYGFTCTCPICSDSPLQMKSDQRRRLIKRNYFVGMMGQATVPDFSAKALGIDGPMSTRPIGSQRRGVGFHDGMQIFRPGTQEFMRHTLKLMYDDGLMCGEDFWMHANIYASTALIRIHKKMKAQMGMPTRQDLVEMMPLQKLFMASTILQVKTRAEDDPFAIQLKEDFALVMNMFNVIIMEPMTIKQSEEAIREIMEREPDPLVERHWRPRAS